MNTRKDFRIDNDAARDRKIERRNKATKAARRNKDALQDARRTYVSR